MNDALLLVDVLNDFRHDDGARLSDSFRDAHPQLRDLLSSSRDAGVPVIYANDHFGDWTATAMRSSTGLAPASTGT
jgi:nicotinamidase-related amidase